MKVTVVDSPVANLTSICSALRAVGADVELTADAPRIAAAERIVLPGVGAFPAAMRWLDTSGVADALRHAASNGAAMLGVCLGMQLLFDRSLEERPTRGLGLIGGEVVPLSNTLPVPLVGWNRVRFNGDPLFSGVPAPSDFYFVHSYRVAPDRTASVVATASYGDAYPAAVRQDRIYGVQFHPEKSSVAGLRLIANFLELS